MNPERREARRIKNFWRKVRRLTSKKKCWEWLAALDKYGYGMFYVGPNSTIHANRFALSLKLGRTLAKEELALHTCDNPKCVNPGHLFIGTVAQNVADRQKKGRTSRGWVHAATTGGRR